MYIHYMCSAIGMPLDVSGNAAFVDFIEAVLVRSGAGRRDWLLYEISPLGLHRYYLKVTAKIHSDLRITIGGHVRSSVHEG